MRCFSILLAWGIVQAFHIAPKIAGSHIVFSSPLFASTKVLSDLTDENMLLRNEITRKDAIIEGLLATLTATAMSTSLSPAGKFSYRDETKTILLNPNTNSLACISLFIKNAPRFARRQLTQHRLPTWSSSRRKPVML